MQEIELLNTLQELIKSGDQSNIQLAFELRKGQNISEEQLLLPWESLIRFLETHYIDFMNIRKETSIEILSKITQATTLNSVLQFDQTQINKLPKSIGLMINLKEIGLNNNHLSSLPKSFKDLSNLRYLDIVQNNIKSLPKELKSLTSLEEIYWNSNDIQDLSTALNFPPSLKILTLHNKHYYE